MSTAEQDVDRHHPARKQLFDQNVELYALIEAKHDGEHNPKDQICIVIAEPVEGAHCPICREASATLLNPEYAPLEQVLAALELGGLEP
ncbi:hypothetical protein GS810_01680 [Rhodococcus hoagii]|nr:hypothetical protein [Prescottella equi]NKU90783.1 hypothetical protein [Prescottella equi]